MTKLYKRIAT